MTSFLRFVVDQIRPGCRLNMKSALDIQYAECVIRALPRAMKKAHGMMHSVLTFVDHFELPEWWNIDMLSTPQVPTEHHAKCHGNKICSYHFERLKMDPKLLNSNFMLEVVCVSNDGTTRDSLCIETYQMLALQLSNAQSRAEDTVCCYPSHVILWDTPWSPILQSEDHECSSHGLQRDVGERFANRAKHTQTIH